MFLWDAQWMIAIGIFAAIIGHTFRRDRSRAMVYTLLAGLALVAVLMLAGVWAYLEIDPNWMLGYLYAPTDAAVAFCVVYPIGYILGFLLTTLLIQIGKDRWLVFGFAVWWIVFTIVVAPRFYLLYGSEWWWAVTTSIDNFLFIPTPIYALGPIFLGLFILTIVVLGAFLVFGIYYARQRKRCPNPMNRYCYVTEG